MSNDWKTYKLGDIASIQTGPFGTQLHQKDYTKTGTPIITVEHLGENRIVHKNLPRVSEKDKERLKKYCIQTGDIVFSRVGSVDRRAFVSEKEDGWLFSGRCLRVRTDNKNIDGAFLSHYFGQESFKEFIRRIAVGATMPSLNTSILSSIEVSVPENFQEQKSIAQILSTIDDKIQNNLAINKTLEEMAMALYKHWFVDFGPFQDGEFVESELGLIPYGWEVKKLKDICNITIGRTPPRKEPKWFSFSEGVKWISIKDIGNSGIYISATSECLSEEAVKKFNVPIIQPNTVILSFKLTVGRVAISTERMISNEAIAHLNRKDEIIPVEFLYSYLKLFDYNTLGSTSSIATAVNSQTIKAMKIIVPKHDVLEDYRIKIFSLFQEIKNNQNENQTLTQLRNTLLPKLISGEIRLKEFRE